MIKKQVLGTAQFGLDYYGISNFSKKKNINQLMPLLLNAYRNGVKFFDTAPDYKSEKILGKFIEKYKLYDKVNVITKIPKLKKNKDYLKQISESIIKSYKKLKVKKLFCVLMHHQSDFKMIKNEQETIKLLKEKFKIRNFGFSVYDLNEAKKILKNFPNAALQFPYNLMNNDFRKIKKNKNLFFARSIFCQGLLTSKKIKTANNELNSSFKKYINYIKLNNINPVKLCLDYAYSNKKIDYIVYGVKDIQEFNEIMEYKKNKKLDKKKIKKIQTFFKLKNMDPRKW